MSLQETNTTEQDKASLPHLIINTLPIALSLYSPDGILLRQFEPSGSPVHVVHFWQPLDLPAPLTTSYEEIGHVPIEYSCMDGEQQVFATHLVPVVAAKRRMLRMLGISGSIQGLPPARPADIVYQPRWFIVSEKAAQLAAKEGRNDVLTFDVTTLLFDEEHAKGILRFVQW